MKVYHKELSAGRWFELAFFDQMAHVGSEVIRAISWRNRNEEYSRRAVERALELLWLTIEDEKNKSKPSRLRELTRLKEVLIDYFYLENQYGSTENAWKKYFNAFAYASRKKS